MKQPFPAPDARLAAERAAQIEARKKLLAALAVAGWTWPPKTWQRVEIWGNRHPSDPPGPVLGTLLYSNGSYYYVVPDCIEENNPYARECYDAELRPVLDDLTVAWLPLRFWVSAHYHEHLHEPTAIYEVQLRNGATATECYAKRQPGGYYQFQEINLPYRRYEVQQVVALRLSHPNQ